MGQHGYRSKDTRTTYGWRRLTCACHLPAVGLWPLHSPLCAFLFTCTMLSEWNLLSVWLDDWVGCQESYRDGRGCLYWSVTVVAT